MLFSAGDVLAQAIGGFEGGLDWQRIGRAAVFGGVLLGPMAHGHFNFLEYIVKRMAVRPTLQPFVKVLFDQVVYWAPFINTVYISFMYVASCMCADAQAQAPHCLESLCPVSQCFVFACCQVTPPPPAQPPARALCEGADVQQRVQERLWPTLKANYILWPAAQVRKLCTEFGAILRAYLSQPPNPSSPADYQLQVCPTAAPVELCAGGEPRVGCLPQPLPQRQRNRRGGPCRGANRQLQRLMSACLGFSLRVYWHLREIMKSSGKRRKNSHKQDYNLLLRRHALDVGHHVHARHGLHSLWQALHNVHHLA